MKLTATITDSNDGIVRLIYEEGEKREVSSLTLTDFIQSLEQSQGDSLEEYQDCIGLMPEGYINARYSKRITPHLSGEIVFRVKGQQRMMIYCGEPYVVPVPDLIFHLVISNGKLKKDGVFAVNEKDELCKYPFTNVYPDGHICWGSFKAPEVLKFADATEVAEAFLRFPGNSDLSCKDVLTKAKKPAMGEFLKVLEDKKVFPKKYLIPNGIKISDLMK